MKNRIIIASGNSGKINEFKKMLSNYEIIPYKDLVKDIEIIENGNSFYENALIKAKTISEVLKEDVLSDDSGLMVDALQGAPGIYTARYAGENATSEENIDKLLLAMKGIKNRCAKFCCFLVLYKKTGEIISAYGETQGHILEERTGKNGFGYNPIFFSDELNKSFGVAEDEERNRVSHRGKALKILMEKLK